ncbi:sensor histidine kinase [Virgibacillus kimchii]
MRNWYHIFPENTGLSAFTWIVFCLLPFYFIFRSSSLTEVIIGIILIVLFFAAFRLAFIKQGWTVYVSVGVEMAISIWMTLNFGYVYFSLFLAFFIGNIQNKAGFITLYVVHLVTTISAVAIGFFIQNQIFLTQLPFIIISIIGVILLPFNMYNRNKQEKLENQLEVANKKISELIVMEERQRIARDLHDTLGQKLSLIGLKSDLAKRLIPLDAATAKSEVEDIHQTARTALKEVRELVSDMKSIRLKDEIIHVRQMLNAAQIKLKIEGTPDIRNTPLLVENVLSLCMKEAITNVVKHSQATTCHISIMQSPSELQIQVKDNGIGLSGKTNSNQGNGLAGMRERLEFVNGNLEITDLNGTTMKISVPHVIQQSEKEWLL